MLRTFLLFTLLVTSIASARDLVDLELPDEALVPTVTAAHRVCLRREFIEASEERYRLPKGMLTACMLAEHTLLIDWRDYLADWAAWLKLYKTGSIGFAQMKVATARNLRKNVFPRSPRVTDDRILLELFDDEIALLYAGAYLRHAIDVYRRYKVPVRDWVGTVCTLYASGGASRKAKRHARRGTRPKLHFYGRFASRNFEWGKTLMRSNCSYASIRKLLQ